MLKYVYVDNLDDLDLQQQLKGILVKYDDSFIPPLSSRDSTIQKFGEEVENPSIDVYLQQLLQQEFIVVLNPNCELAGFMSFILGYVSKETQNAPLLYVTTIIVGEEYRGQKITNKLYKKLFRIAKSKGFDTIGVRTWDSNYAHLKILGRTGFEHVSTIENDRGEGISTVYYKKSLRD